MTSLIPGMMFLFVFVSMTLVMSHSPVKTDVDRTIAMNMMLQHLQAVRLAKASGQTSGDIADPIGGVGFVDLGNWVSSVRTTGGETAVLTMVRNSDKVSNDDLTAALAKINAKDMKILPTKTGFGPFSEKNGVGYVGSLDVNLFAPWMTVGQNVFVSIIK